MQWQRMPPSARLRRAVLAAAAISTGSAVAALALTGAWITAAPAAAFIDPTVWGAGARTAAGGRAAACVAGLVCVSIGMCFERRWFGRASIIAGALWRKAGRIRPAREARAGWRVE